MVFSKPKLLHIKKSLPRRNTSAPLKCLLVSRSKTARGLFAALRSILTDPNPWILQLNSPRVPPGLRWILRFWCRFVPWLVVLGLFFFFLHYRHY